MNKKNWIIPGIFVILVFAAVLALITPNNKSIEITENKWPILRVGYLPIAATLPLFVAIEEGYFEEVGIEIKLVRMSSSNEIVNAATADRIDAFIAASNAVFDAGHVSGKRHLVYAVNPYSDISNHVTDHLIVRKGSGIKTLSELKGRKIASFPGSVNRIFTELILQKHGVPVGSYDYIELLPKDWQPALQSGTVDAISALEPVATQIINDGIGVSIFQGFYADLMPDVPLSAHWISRDFYNRADPKQLSAFLNTFEKAIKFSRKNEAKKYLVKYANVREDILEDVNLNDWKGLSEIDTKTFQDYIDILADNGALQAKVDILDYVLKDPRV